MSVQRVLVTGAGGFIGHHALAPLRERGLDVHAVVRGAPRDEPGVTWHVADLLDAGQRRRVVDEVGAEKLLNLAWGADGEAWVEATAALAEEFAAAGGRRAVMAGSCAEYDWTAGAPFDESRTAIAPASSYGACKHAAHRRVQTLVPELAWARIFFVYGPFERPPRLVASIARALANGERAATTAGAQRRDYSHAADVGDALAALLAGDVRGAVNVGSGEAVAVREVARMLADRSGRPELLDIGALPARPGDPEEIVAAVGRLRDEVGWMPSIALEDGLAQTLDWWRASQGP